jgi:hypothetical protein
MDKIAKLLSSSEDPEKKKMLVEALLAQIASNQKKEVIVEEHIKLLVEISKSFSTKQNVFKVGDLVVWKKGLKHKKVPNYSIPAVVIEVLDSPIIDNQAPIASPYYGEKLDLLLGILDDDNDFLCFHYDSQRFELYSPLA